MLIKNIEGQVFNEGNVYTIDFSINETSNSIADNIFVTFTVFDENDTEINNVTITDNVLSVGTYATNVWNIGTLVGGGTVTGRFDITLNDNNVSYMKVIAEVTTTTSESVVSNNIGTWIYRGVNSNNLSSTLFSSGEFWTGTYFDTDKLYGSSYYITSIDGDLANYDLGLVKTDIKAIISHTRLVIEDPGTGTVYYKPSTGYNVFDNASNANYHLELTTNVSVADATRFTIYYTKN